MKIIIATESWKQILNNFSQHNWTHDFTKRVNPNIHFFVSKIPVYESNDNNRLITVCLQKL